MAENCWQCQTASLRQRGRHILKSGLGADCHFLVGVSGGGDGAGVGGGGGGDAGNNGERIIAAHKMFLIMSSPVFERIFNEQKNAELIEIPDIKPDVFEKVLEYIYTEHVVVDDVSEACEQYYVAKKYLLAHLSKELMHYIKKHICASNACQVYEFAKLYNYESLMVVCLDIIRNQTVNVLIDPSFLNITPSTMMTIFQQDYLNITSELQLFEALVKYREYKQQTSLPIQVAEVAASCDEDNADNSNIEIHGGDHQQQQLTSMVFQPDVLPTTSPFAPATSVPRTTNGGDPPPTPVMVSTSSQSLNERVSNLTVVINRNDIDVVTAHLIEALKCIRFLTMTTRQFAQGPARFDLLDSEVKLAIFINLCEPGSYPMPEGFTQLRVLRRNPHCTCTSRSLNELSRRLTPRTARANVTPSVSIVARLHRY